MRSSQEIQNELEQLKNNPGQHSKTNQNGKKVLDPARQQVYEEAIRRAQLEEQAAVKRDFENQVEEVLNGPPAHVDY